MFKYIRDVVHGTYTQLRSMVMVFSHGRWARISEAFNLSCIATFKPTCRMKRTCFELDRYIVFRADAVREDIKLQSADDANDPVWIHNRLENAGGTLFGNLQKGTSKMFCLHWVFRANLTHQFRRKARDTGEN